MIRTKALARHFARFALGATLVVLAVVEAPWVVLVAGPYFFLGTFAFQHDVMHGALGLPKAWREPLLAWLGATMFMSGHATRTMHLLHHRRFHEPEDLEGATIDGTLPVAVLRTPSVASRMRVAAYTHAGSRDRRWQIAEHALNVLSAIVVVASGFGVAYLAVCVAFQLTMPMWAGRIPHRVPAWGLRIAAFVARFGSVTAASLAYHELHHRRPSVPTHDLG